MADIEESTSQTNTNKNGVGRSNANHEIELDCVKININGSVNSSSNARCAGNNNTGDGFVYNCKTKNVNGKYQYDYVDTGSAWEADKLSSIGGFGDGDGEKARNTTIDHIRGNNETNEGIINILDEVKGKLTGLSTTNFIYNEGNSDSLGDGKNKDENTSSNGIQVKSISNKGEYTITDFYDKQSFAFEEHPALTKIRNLKESSKNQ